MAASVYRSSVVVCFVRFVSVVLREGRSRSRLFINHHKMVTGTVLRVTHGSVRQRVSLLFVFLMIDLQFWI